MRKQIPFRLALVVVAMGCLVHQAQAYIIEEAVHEVITVNLEANNSSSAACGVTTPTTTVLTTVTITTQPDTPRNLQLYTVDNSAVLTGLRVIVRGTNQWGHLVSETFVLSAAVTTGSARLTGDIAFARLSSIEYRDAVGYATSTAFVLSYGNKFGCTNQVSQTGDVFKLTRATAFAAPADVAAAGYTVNVKRGTVAPTTSAATDEFHVWSRRSLRKSKAMTKAHSLIED
jgi:hypothetical protein